MKIVVISAATGMSATDVRPLARSLARVCPTSRLILLTEKSSATELIRLKHDHPNLELEFMTTATPRLRVRRMLGFRGIRSLFAHAVQRAVRHPNRTLRGGVYGWTVANLHVAIRRYFYLRRAIGKHAHVADCVVHCDSRDVVFQDADFHQHVSDRLLVAEEDWLIGDEPSNRSWIAQLAGHRVLQQLASQRVICSGVTLGSFWAMRNYADKMRLELLRRLATVRFSAGFDQGIHNLLIRAATIEAAIMPPSSQVIAHLGPNWTSHFHLDPKRGLISRNSHALVSIVHQYDRKPELVDFYSKLLEVSCPQHAILSNN